MKKRVSLLLVVVMLLSMLPVAVFAAEPTVLLSVTNEEVTTAGYTFEYTAETAGILNVSVGTCSPGWRYRVYSPDGTESIYRTKWNATENCDYEIVPGDWKIVFYAYSSAEADNVAGTVSFTVSFTPSEGEEEVQKVAYEIAPATLAMGDNTLTLLDTAVTTIYVFEPTETAVYTFTAPEGAILGYWGAGSWFLSDPGSTTNICEWTCTGVGQKAFMGVSGVDGEFNLNVEKTGDYTVVEIPIVPYENKATLEAFTIPDGAKLGSYVDVYSDTVHTAVLGDDGYYHLDSADGDVLVMDLNYMDIILSAALKSDRPVMYAYMTDENGNQFKYDIGNAILAYEAVMDENGYYPVTEDILLFYQVYAVQAGTFTFHLTGDYNEECVWMYCMRTMNMDNVVDPEPDPEPSEPETEPSEPDPEPSVPETEPTEPVAGVIIVDEAVTATAGSKYSKYYKATADGTLIVTVGDGSTNYHAEIATSPSLGKYETQVFAEGSAKQTISLDVVANTQYYVRVWAVSGALALTPLTITFVEGGAVVEPSEPETEPTEPSVPTEPSEPETEPTEPSVPTEPSEPETEPTEPSVPSIPDENVPAGTVYSMTIDGQTNYYTTAAPSSINKVLQTVTGTGYMKLYKDISLGTSISNVLMFENGTVTVDLNGNNISFAYASVGALYVNGGTLIVVDTSAEGDGMVENTHNSGYGIEVWNGTACLKSGNVYGGSNAVRMYDAGDNFYMEGGTLTAQRYAVNAPAGSAAAISGGTLTATLANQYAVFAASTATVTITGGYFNGTVSGSGLNGKISGGYFIKNVSSGYIASGCELQTNNDATYKYKVVDPNEVEPDPSEPETEPTEPVKDAYAVSTTILSVGSNTVSMISTADATIFKFTPAEAGTYTITGPEGSKVGIWGYSSNMTDPNSTSNSCELPLANAGPIVRVGVTGVEGQIVLTIEKEEEIIDPSEPTEPDESEPTEPDESGALLSVTNEEVTVAGYTFEYTAATAGTLNVTVGECSPGWRYKIYSPDGTESLYRTKYTAGETCDYTGEAGNWKVVFYAYSSAEADNVAGTVSFTVTFTPDEEEVAGPVEVANVNAEAVTTSGYVVEYNAATAGTLHVSVGDCNPGWRYKVFSPDGVESGYRSKYTAGTECDYHNVAGNWKIVFYAYSSAEADNVEGTVSFTVTFTPDSSAEVEKEEYQVSDTALALGNNTLTLLDTAETTIFVFEPTETGVFTFTAPAGAILGYWGAGSWFLQNPNSTTNTYEWTCTGVGQSAYIGVSGVDGTFSLNVAKTGDYTVVEIPIVEYENKATLETFTLPEGATLGGYVDVYSDTVHTAVLGDDGYYHLDSVDGPILLIDLDYMDIILSAALKSDRPVMYAYMTNEDGSQFKYDIGNAILAYEAVMDDNGYYPLTEDLLLFYKVYAMQAGTFTFHLSGSYNEECVWMYCMRTMVLPEPEPEPVYVAAVYADGAEVAQYTTVTEAIANCGEGQYVVLLDNVTEQITVNSNVYLDLNGFNAEGITVADGCTLFLFDSATDDYQGVYGTAVVTGTVESIVNANGKSYLVVCEDGKYSAHRYALELTHISLDATNDALGYKAELKGDSFVQNAVTAYGFTMGVQLEKTYELTENFDGTFTLRLKGIMAAGGGEMNITATAFVKFGEYTAETAQEETTMKETLQAVNNAWGTYSQAQKDTVVALCKQYESITSQWELDNIFDVINGVIDIPITGNPDGNP